jgi:hypothetical protein
MSATYADDTPEGDLIDHWLVNMGDGQGVQNLPGGAASASGSYTAGSTGTAGTSATGSFVAATNISGSDYVIERFDPATSGWSAVITLPATADGATHTYTYVDNGPGGAGLTPGPGGVPGGYLYRVAAQGAGCTAASPGSPGLSAYTPAVPLSAASSGFGSESGGPQDTAVTGIWTPTDGGGTQDQYVGSQQFTTTVNLPSHMGYTLGFGVGGGFANGGSATLVGVTGTGQTVINQTVPIESGFAGFNFSSADQNTTRSVSLTLSVNCGSADTYYVGYAGFVCEPGEFLFLAGSTYVGVGTEQPVTVFYAGPSPASGVMLTAVSSDPAVFQVLNPSVTTTNGTATFDVEGVGSSSSTSAYLVVTDAAGDHADRLVEFYAVQPTTLTLTAAETNPTASQTAETGDSSTKDLYVAEQPGTGKVVLALSAHDNLGHTDGIVWGVTSTPDDEGASPEGATFVGGSSKVTLTPGDTEYVLTATEGTGPNAITAVIDIHVLGMTAATEGAGNTPGMDLPKAGQITPGVFVPWDTLDEDYDGTPDYKETTASTAKAVTGDTEMAEITLHAVRGASGNYKLTIPAGIAVFSAPDGSHPVTSATAISAASNTTLYVEGISKNGTGTLYANWSNGTQTVTHADMIKFTDFSWTGPQDVPDNSTYQYNLSGGLPKSGWTSVGSGMGVPSPGSISAGTKGTKAAQVTWGGGTDVGEVVATINPSFTWQFPVNVVHVDVDVTSTGVVNSVSYGSPPAASATPVNGGGTPIGQVNVSSSASGGFSMHAKVTIAAISGPSVGGQMRGVKWIQVGAIQTAEVTHDYATYDPVDKNDKALKPVNKTDVGHQDGGVHPDYDTGNPRMARPSLWYETSSAAGFTSFFQATNDGVVSSFVLTEQDGPILEVAPNLKDNYAGHPYSVASVNLHVDFKIYVVVATSRQDDPLTTTPVPPQGIKNLESVYTERAMTSWYFDGSGSIAINGINGTWTGGPNAKVTGSSTFTAVDPATPFSYAALKDLTPANLLPTRYVWP